MAQNTAQQARLIGARIRASATVLLTRREDVSIQEVTEDFGIDLIATIAHQDKAGLRQLGVELKGVWAKVTAEHASMVLRPSMRKMLRYGPFPFPVAVFFYTMEDDAGWYTWTNEPLISVDGGCELRTHEEADCRPLNDAAVDEIIDRVDAYYDLFYSKNSKGMPKARREK